MGLTPKSTGQLLRFGRALTLLTGPGLLMPETAAPSPMSISEVAAETGYADHSHLVREFRRLTGLPPSALVRRAAS
ncbi:helix-turn-helix domain-containing protein [Pseudonocardia spinosispora]|uniref:helix-turn-helix domain-containing protein n=1 Tax=Pseudonocardia spinosispora TaxID=103441 RepID=UPI0003FFAB92|nr:helix-turn-helix domain-containing protein [Pseudonocardia spinosispora]